MNRRTHCIFQPTPFGGYAAEPGDSGTLAETAGGAFTLTECNGQVTQFQNGQVAYIQDTDGNRITAGYTSGLSDHIDRLVRPVDPSHI